MKYLSMVIILLACFGNHGSAADLKQKYPEFPAPRFQAVSIVALIADPLAYDGKKVRVSGYLNFIGEYNTVYYSKEAGLLGNSAEGISVEFGDSKYSGMSWSTVKAEFDNKYAYLLGTFHAGHSINVGLLTDIEDISTVSIPEE